MPAQRLPGLHSGVKATVVPGDPMHRSMSQYGKGYDPTVAANAALPDAPPSAGPTPLERGGKGGMKTNPKFGGMGAGKFDSYGPQSGFAASGDNS